jgi:hypothetical protein
MKRVFLLAAGLAAFAGSPMALAQADQGQTDPTTTAPPDATPPDPTPTSAAQADSSQPDQAQPPTDVAATGDYPPCSRTVTDHCTQGGGHHGRHHKAARKPRG